MIISLLTGYITAPAPDLGLEHKIGTLCRNNSAKYHVSGDPDLAAEKRKVIKKPSRLQT